MTPIFRQARQAARIDAGNPWAIPADATAPPQDAGPIDQAVADPYVENPSEGTIAENGEIDLEAYLGLRDDPEGPIDEPVPDPYVEEDPPVDPTPPGDNEGPIDEPVPDPYVEGPIDEPVPDPYVEEDPPVDPTPPGDNEGPIDEPVPDPYVEGGEYESVMPLEAGMLPARAADAAGDGMFRRWGAVLGLGGLRFDYMARYQPGHLRGSAFHAIRRALATWDRETPLPLFGLCYIGEGQVGPGRDGRNVICWRTFTGPGAAFPAVVYLWDNGHNIVEADIVLNANRAFGVAAPLAAGEERTLTNMAFDLQAVVTHEVGHVLGLADRDDQGGEGSTMSHSMRMRELRAQTLTEGDRKGLQAVLQRAKKAPPR